MTMTTVRRQLGLVTTIAATTAVAALGMAATSHAAANEYLFQSPSGNIACDFTDQGAGSAHLYCAIEAHSFDGTPMNADTGKRCTDHNVYFNMQQGMTPIVICDTDEAITGPLLHRPGLWTLGYGQSLAAGKITCDSQSTGMTCSDATTGHYFRVARDSYDMG
jgi:hypothetical protein